MATQQALPPASFDSVVLAAVLPEIEALVGSRVQRVVQAGPDGMALVLRRSGAARIVLASVHPRWGRIHLAQHVAPTEPGPFAGLLRARLDGAVLRGAAMPAFERILTLTFATLEGPLEVIVEVMGRHGNILLVAGGVTVGALKYVGPDRSRVRPVQPQRPYVPPPQNRPDPLTVTPADLARTAGDAPPEPRGDGSPSAPPPAWRVVLAAVAGIGPPLAHEACLRGGVDPGSPLRPERAAAIVEQLREIGAAVVARQVEPVLYRTDDGTPVAYAAFSLQCYAACRAEPSGMSAAVETVTAVAAEADRLEAVRQGLAAAVARAAGRVRRALAAAAEDAAAASEADRLREQGELILAYLQQVTPGADTLEVPGFDGSPVQIALDPRRPAVDNAQVYFRRFAKAKAAQRRLPQRQATLEAELDHLDTLATAIAQAETTDDLWELEQDLVAAGLRRRAGPAVRPGAAASGRAFDLPGGLRVQVGRGARENDHLTFEVAGPNDLWLHARGMPGAHVILLARGRRKDEPPPEAAVEAAARVAAYYSAGRGSAKVLVDVTPRRFVRRIPRGKPGQVRYSGERTIVVRPGLPDAE